MTAAFRWQRALAKALGYSAATLVVIVIYARVSGHAQPAHASRKWFAGVVVVLGMGGISLATSYLSHIGRGGVAQAVWTIVAVASVGAGQLFRMRTDAVTLTASEREPLVIVDDNGERRLQHPKMRWSLLHPGPGFAEAGGQIFEPSGAVQAFVDKAAGSMLTVSLVKGEGGSPADLRKFLENMSKEVTAATGNTGGPVRVVRFDVPSDEPPRGEVEGTIGDTRRYRLAAYGVKEVVTGCAALDDRFAVVLTLVDDVSTTEDHGAVLKSFRP